MVSTRERLASYKAKVLAVAMPEIGDDAVFHVKQISAVEQLRWSSDVQAAGKSDDDELKIEQNRAFLEMTLCEPDGARLFGPGEFDWACLGDMTWDLMHRLNTAAFEVNGMREEDQASAEGNSGPTAPGDLRIA